MNKNKKLAFTLAEVLIVIGIIGVVAALTLPNLNHATGDKEKVTKVKKIYSALTEAVDRAQAIYGPYDTWFNDLAPEEFEAISKRFAKRVTEFMKVSKDCGFDSGCFSNADLLDIYGNVYYENYLSSLQASALNYMVIVSDGISLAFYSGGSSAYGKIRVDIDGPNKGKNQMGNDIFDFTIIKDDEFATPANQLIPSSQVNQWTGNYVREDVEDTSYATAWVIENGNLDYLKCPDELNWETKTSCE